MALYGVVSPISIIILACISRGLAIQCYQCDSNEDHTCPSGYGFDKTVNAMLDCNGFEADVPGQFCVKIYQESPGWVDGRKQQDVVGQELHLVWHGVADGPGTTLVFLWRPVTVKTLMVVTAQGT